LAHLRTLRILEEINLLFEEHDFELRANKKLRQINRYKLQPVFNINGTVTVVASYGNGNAVHIAFSGNGIVDLWPHQGVFLIDREKNTPEEIRKRFRNMLETEYGFEFRNGGHSALAGETVSGMLLHPRIIPQIFKVFREEDFSLQMCHCNILIHSWSNRLNGGILTDGRVFINVGIENLADEYSYVHSVNVLFDGSDNVGIIDRCNIEKIDDLNDTGKLHMVALDDAIQVLIEQYGASFDKEWRMNKAPVFDPCGIPFDPDYWFRKPHDEDFDDGDKELVHGYFLAEGMLNTLMPDDTFLDAGFADCDDMNIDFFDHLFNVEDED